MTEPSAQWPSRAPSRVSSGSMFFLDQIPEPLYQRLITRSYGFSSHPQVSAHHRLSVRCRSVLEIRQHLLHGKAVSLSCLQSWLDPASKATMALQQIQSSLTEATLLQATQGNEQVTDEAIIAMLDWLEEWQNRISEGSTEAMESRPSLQNKSIVEASSAESVEPSRQVDNNLKHDRPLVESGPELEPEGTGECAPPAKVPELEASQPQLLDAQQLEKYQALAGLHQSFAIERQLAWDLSRGVRHKTDAERLMALHKRVQASPYIQSIVQLIGRHQNQPYDDQNRSESARQYQTNPVDNEALPDEHSVNSVSGICLGDDISRMMPSELVKLLGDKMGYKSLKTLWHAQRAERQLLNYHIRGVLSEHTAVMDQSIDPQSTNGQKQLVLGPMVICVDTSASMKGQPEYLAKAVTLEIMRLAQQQKRKCYCYAFSGPEQVVEYALDIVQHGWKNALQFFNQSFSGGTDIDGVLEKAFGRLSETPWRKADCLILSDGRFKLRHKTSLETFKRQHPGCKLYGLQLSQWNPRAFNEICHQVFNVSHV